MEKIDYLLEEIVDFAELIAYSENPANPDFQHACSLFCRYLNHQFKHIDNATNTLAWSPKDLKHFQQLLTPPQNNSRSCIEWIRQLFQHTLQLQKTQALAA